MSNASRDANRVPVIMGVSSIDLETPTRIAANPSTGALLIDGTSLYTTLDSRYVNISGDTISGELALSTPLASGSGGTGVANTNTLTLPAFNTVIAAAGAYTVTIPQTGTVAMLSAQNMFSEIQKINTNSTTALVVEQDGVKDNVLVVDTTNGRVGINKAPTLGSLDITGGVFSTSQNKIDGTSDQIQLIVQGHSTQTANLQEWQNSSGTRLSAINGSGFAGFGTAPLSTTIISAWNSFTAITGYQYGVSGIVYLNPSGATTSLRGYGLNFAASTLDGNTRNVEQITGTQLTVSHSGSGTVGSQIGLILFNQSGLTTGTATTTSNIGIQLYTVKIGAGSTWNITTQIGLRYTSPIVTSGTLNITNEYGIYLDNVSKGTTLNYAIVTNAGSIVFNEGGDASTDFRVESDTEANMLFLDANGDTDGALYLGGTTNGIKINKGGELTLLGTATVFNDQFVDGLSTKGGATDPPTFAVFQNGVWSNRFDNGATMSAHATLELQHDYKDGSNLEIHVHWSPSTTNTGDCRWGVEYTVANQDNTAFPATTTIYVNTPGSGTALAHQYATVGTITGTGLTKGAVIAYRIFRDGANAADTFTGNSFLHRIAVHYECDKLGSST